ncbi:MAG: hypothetical protein IJ874_06060 [Ruminococcus sp.]|nr:hypothetical protein [Ruminococcus sp.]
MKRSIAIIAAVSLLCTAAVSCGKDETPDSSSEQIVLELPETEIEAATDAGETAETTTEEAEKTTEKAEKTKAAETTAAETTETTTTAAAEEPAAEEPEDTDGEQPETPAEETPEEPQQSAEPDPEPVQEPEPAEPDNNTQTGMAFSYDTLGSNAGMVIEALGQPKDTLTAAGCFTNGADEKDYIYDDIEIKCYVIGGVEYIYNIVIKGGDYATPEGIRPGSSRSEAEAVYGSGETYGDMVVYFNGDKELDITYSGDTAVTVEYYMNPNA